MFYVVRGLFPDCGTRDVVGIDGSVMGPPDPAEPQSDEKRAEKVRRFSKMVTAALIVFCNVVLLFGVWVTGINLDELVTTPELFNAKEDVCLRLTWERVTGAPDPVRLCSEWIKLADPSGKPHHLTNYLYELATRYHAFFENCPVLQSEEGTRASRLALCDLVARYLAKGLDLLGIEHPEQM